MFPAKVFPADEEEEVEEESKSTRRRRRRKAGLLSWLWKSWRLLRLVAVEVLVYLALYYAINLAYRFALDERQKEQFAKVGGFFYIFLIFPNRNFCIKKLTTVSFSNRNFYI